MLAPFKAVTEAPVDIVIAGLTKRFGETRALDGVTMTVQPGELLALLGPSGSGKTTLLRIIAGLETAEEGDLSIGGTAAIELAPRERGIGFVFQHYALFRHMSVFENIAFGLRVRPRAQRLNRRAIADRVNELLSLVQLDGMGGRYPNQLSGGQRQRVALARALAVQPKVLLLDEPFGALDAKVRVELRHWLRGLQRKLGLTTVFVTHDQEEALELADRVAILNAGRIEQLAPPREVYDGPNSAFVIEFLGEVNRFTCRVMKGQARLAIAGCDPIAAPGVPDAQALAYVRPHEIELMAAQAAATGLAEIRSLSVIGPRTRIHLAVGDHVIEADVERSLAESLGAQPGVQVGFRFKQVRIYPATR
jgi:sulfate/thiosulfate transport system ATP-binding protein